jgi:putative two-component system response regulator
MSSLAATPNALPLPPVLIAEDEAAVREVLGRALRLAGFQVHEAADGLEALAFLQKNACEVLLTDIQMPRLRGNDLVRIVRERFPDIGLLLITAITDIERAVECLRAGADDYITKPFVVADVVVRVHHTLEAARERANERRRREQQESSLTKQAVANVAGMREHFLQSLTYLSEAAEAQDTYRRGHTARLIETVSVLLPRFYRGEDAFAQYVLTAARLHEIVWVTYPQGFLGQPASLSSDDRELLQRSALVYLRVLQPLFGEEDVPHILYSHHENWDGMGYPDGLQGEQIPRGARLLAVVDAFVAMTSPRPHRPAYSIEETLSRLQAGAGTQWDPESVAALVSLFPR